MKKYIIGTLICFGISIHAEKEFHDFNAQSDSNAGSSCIDDTIVADALRQFEKDQQSANNDPEHAATWQAMLADLDNKQTHQEKLISHNNQLHIDLQNCAKYPEGMSNANKKLVAVLQKNKAQQFVLFFVGLPTAIIAGIPIAIINPALIAHNQPAQKLALRELLASSFGNAIGVNKKMAYTSNALNIEFSLHTADALSGIIAYSWNYYVSSDSRTATSHIKHASASMMSALIKYSLEPAKTKTLRLGNNRILIFSNKNIMTAIANTAEQAIGQLPKQSFPSVSELARNLAINTGLEISYNITAQIIRETASLIGVPACLIDTCIPEDYESHNCVQHMIKLGINGTTYIAIARFLMALPALFNPGIIQL